MTDAFPKGRAPVFFVSIVELLLFVIVRIRLLLIAMLKLIVRYDKGWPDCAIGTDIRAL